MRKPLPRRTAPAWDQGAPRRWAGGAAVASALGLAACADMSPSDQERVGEERVGEARSAVLGGTLDQGSEPKFPAVVGVQLWLPGEPAAFGVGTGVALSDRVVVTAGHLVPEMLRGCEPYAWDGTALFSKRSRLQVWTATGSDTASGNVFEGTAYNVDAIAGLRRLFPLNAYDCGADTELGCAPGVKENFVPPFDVALLHLDRPLVDAEPMKFVARIGPTHASEATYPIDPSTWPGAVIATVVGVGNSNPILRRRSSGPGGTGRPPSPGSDGRRRTSCSRTSAISRRGASRASGA